MRPQAECGWLRVERTGGEGGLAPSYVINKTNDRARKSFNYFLR